jgi:hypothetical protein
MSGGPAFRYDDGFKPARAGKSRRKGTSRTPRELFDAAAAELASEDGGRWIEQTER